MSFSKQAANQTSDRTEVLLWSIAFPGFGQFLNGKYFKGTLLLILEFLINVQSHLNLVLISSFRGDTKTATEQTDFQWLMFYPCIYMFALWDAYRDAGGKNVPFAYLPFVFAAYLGTIGIIYSANLRIMGKLIGSIWLPIIFMLFGTGLGFLFRFFLVRK